VVKIRLQRTGRKNRPFYRIQVLDERTRRDGASIEQLGWYDPVNRDESKQLNLNEERAKYWLSKGAQPSDTMRDILAKRNLVDRGQWEAVRARRRQVVEAKKAAAPPPAEEKKA
jgi:small subunit ribosomal protein S16